MPKNNYCAICGEPCFNLVCSMDCAKQYREENDRKLGLTKVKGEVK